MSPSHFICLMLLAALNGCSTHPVVVQTPVGPEPPRPPPRNGDLVVYSATYAATAEQSEYPVHTNYTVATTSGKVIERVANASGPFSADPATVVLPSGEYQVRAQYNHGGFVVVPVVIEPNKTTVVDLDGEAPPQHPASTTDTVRLRDGHVVGWRASSPSSIP
jgi:hypothetical protein